MCFKPDIFDIVYYILFGASILVPSVYLIFYIGVKKRKKVIGFFIISILIFVSLTYIREKVLLNFKCDVDEVVNDIGTTSTKASDVSEYFVGKTKNGYDIEKIDGIYYIEGIMIVNKSYALPDDFIPSDTNDPINSELCILCIDNEAYDKWLDMKSDASTIGLNIYIQSGYRSYKYQEGLYQSYVNQSGKLEADRKSARAGHSEHQTALAIDLNTITTEFASTSEGLWVADNAYKYGYIIRYPEGKEDISGYMYEPWHLRYVGADLASKLYNDGDWITIEEYFGIESKYE